MTNTNDMCESERLAREFHRIYEELAPSYGYETKVDTRNFDPSTPNGRLMISTCQKLIEQWQSQQAQGEDLRYRVAAAICEADDGDPNEVIWQGNPPEPFGAMIGEYLKHADAALKEICPSPAPAAVPDEAFNIIEGIRAELTWSGWRKTSSRDWVMDSLSELLSMLTASPAPDHITGRDRCVVDGGTCGVGGFCGSCQLHQQEEAER